MPQKRKDKSKDKLKGKYRSRKKGPVARIIRSILSIVVLSTLVLSITLIIKELSSFNSDKFASGVGYVLQKVNIDINEDALSDFLSNTFYGIMGVKIGTNSSRGSVIDNGASSDSTGEKKELFKIALMSDVHEDLGNLATAIYKAKEMGVSKLFILGDLTNYGDTDSLAKVKEVLDGEKIDYVVIPGDHDIAQSTDVSNFKKVFGSDYQLLDISGVKFLFINNSANFTKMDTAQIAWIENNIKDSDFVLMSQPLYTKGIQSLFNINFEKMYMGSLREDVTDPDLKEKQETVRSQGISLLDLIRKSTNVRAVFAGDHHRSSVVKDEQRSDLNHYVIGAITGVLTSEYSQKILDHSQFTILTVYSDKTFKTENIVID